MNDFVEDTELIQRLVRYAGETPAAVAKRAGVAVSTVNRPFNGSARNRLGRSALEKLMMAYPDFPGWSEDRIGDRRLPFQGTHEVAERLLPRQFPSSARKAPAAPRLDIVEVAGIDLNFGLGGAFMDQEIVEHHAERLPFPRAWLRQVTTSDPDQLYWTRGVGNSMEPAISDGDVILIDRSKVGSSFGDLYWAIAYGQTGMIKRLRPMPDGSVKILSDNANVPPEIAYDGEVHVFGRVVAVVKRV